MRSLISAAVVAAIAFAPAAAARDKPAADGYHWTAPAAPVTTYSMVWTLMGSQRELEAAMIAEGVPVAEADGDPIMDNVRISRKGGYCKAMIIDPAKRLDPIVIFHVTLHCMGWTHDAPEKRGPRGAG